MLTALLRSLRTGVVTLRYPDRPAEVPARHRGAPRPVAGRPFDALPEPGSCLTGAISLDPAAGRCGFDAARCIRCGRCAEAGDGGAVELGHEVEVAARSRAGLVAEAGRGPDGGLVPLPPAPPAAGVERGLRRTLGRSLALRHLDAGSCNACDWELTALLNPVHDVRRLGIDFVASPRHADGVIVTGPVTRNLETAVRRTWEAVPDPRIVIAVGTCACSGGIVGRGYASAGGAGEVLPVDAFVPGCPPRPEAILHGILLALGRARERRAGA